MTHQIIQQPDGLLCVWSTEVDDFIVTDATPEELIESYGRMAAQEARTRTKRVIRYVISGDAKKIYYQFAMTFDEAAALRDWRLRGSPEK